MLGKFKEAKRN